MDFWKIHFDRWIQAVILIYNTCMVLTTFVFANFDFFMGQYGNGGKSGERNSAIGSSGKSKWIDNHYNGGGGFIFNKTYTINKDPKCFKDGMIGGYYGHT